MTPTCAIVNFSSSPIDWMVSLILGRDPKDCEIGSNLIWDIVTKYYTAKVRTKDVLTVLEDPCRTKESEFIVRIQRAWKLMKN